MLYEVITSTDFNVLYSFAEKSEFDLFIIDSEPDPKLEKLCSDIKKSSPNVKIILTYVYSKRTSDAEKRIRDYISTIFYKPFDLADITKSIPDIITGTPTQASYNFV